MVEKEGLWNGGNGGGGVQAIETEPVITSFLDTMHWFSHGIAAVWAKGKGKGRGKNRIYPFTA